MFFDNAVQSLVHFLGEQVGIALSFTKTRVNLLGSHGFSELGLQSGSDTGDGDSGLGTSSSELGSGVDISEGSGLISSDGVSVRLGFWDSALETWVLTSLVKDLD